MRQPPPEIKRGPKILRKWLNQLRAFAIQTRPLESELCDLEEKQDGTQILPRPPKTDTGPTFTITLDGTETVPNGGFYRTFSILNTGLPNGTPVAVDYSLQGYPVMFVGASVNGGTIFLDFWHAEGNVIPPFTMGAGVITVRPIL